MKRRVLIVTVFLLLGAVVNVAVAWGCAASIRRPYTIVDPTGFQVAAKRPITTLRFFASASTMRNQLV